MLFYIVRMFKSFLQQWVNGHGLFHYLVSFFCFYFLFSLFFSKCNCWSIYFSSFCVCFANALLCPNVQKILYLLQWYLIQLPKYISIILHFIRILGTSQTTVKLCFIIIFIISERLFFNTIVVSASIISKYPFLSLVSQSSFVFLFWLLLALLLLLLLSLSLFSLLFLVFTDLRHFHPSF